MDRFEFIVTRESDGSARLRQEDYWDEKNFTIGSRRSLRGTRIPADGAKRTKQELLGLYLR
jgi:hypothetical protein